MRSRPANARLSAYVERASEADLRRDPDDLLLGHVDVAGQPEGHLGLHPGLDQRAHRDRITGHGSRTDVHVAEQVAEVGLVDAQLALHGLRGGADLAAHHDDSAVDPTLHQAPLHGVRRSQVVGDPRGGLAAHQAYPAGHRGLLPALPPSVHAGRPDQPAGPHDPRAGDVRRGPRRVREQLRPGAPRGRTPPRRSPSRS